MRIKLVFEPDSIVDLTKSIETYVIWVLAYMYVLWSCGFLYNKTK